MKLTRFRIVLFAIAVFGAFANFAQNTWGNDIIKYCQLLIALSFFIEMSGWYFRRIKAGQARRFNIFQYSFLIIWLITVTFVARILKADEDLVLITCLGITFSMFLVLLTDGIVYRIRVKHGKPYYRGVFENFFLFMIFLGFFFKNMRWPGGAIILPLGIIFCAGYYVREMLVFLRKNFHKGKGITLLLTLGYLTTVALGFCALWRMMYYPGWPVLLNVTLGLVLVMILVSLRWKFTYDGKKITIVKALDQLRSQIVPVFFGLLIYFSYWVLLYHGMAPSFYAPRYPPITTELQQKGMHDEAGKVIDAYRSFLSKVDKHGF